MKTINIEKYLNKFNLKYVMTISNIKLVENIWTP